MWLWDFSPMIGPPPKDEKAMVEGASIDRTWALHHADEDQYLKWATSSDRDLRELATLLRWRMSPEVQTEVLRKLQALPGETPWALAQEVLRIHSLTESDQTDYWQFTKAGHIEELEWIEQAASAKVLEPALLRASKHPPCHTVEMFQAVQGIRWPHLLDLGVLEEVRTNGRRPLSNTELSRLASESPCYYEFLLEWHPKVRQRADIIARLREADLLNHLDHLDLLEHVPPEELSLFQRQITGRWRGYAEQVKTSPPARLEGDLGYLSLYLSPEEYCAVLLGSETYVGANRPFVA
jgi:hypothetical protein